MTKQDRFKAIILKGIALLDSEKSYHQITIQKKLKTVGVQIAPATLNNIINHKKVRDSTLQIVAEGISSIVKSELGKAYHVGADDYLTIVTPEWKPMPVAIPTSEGIIFHHGRLEASEKAVFMASASREIIEVGVRLNSFTTYFTSLKDQDYKSHIIDLMRRGVSMKVYLLDPGSQEASLYFTDRAKVQVGEKDAIDETLRVIDRLKMIAQEFNSMQLEGSFEIYLYKHIPYGMFLVVDADLPSAKILVSMYLYGVRRAQCPVMEFSKNDQTFLFNRYWESVQAFIAGARKL